MRPLKQEFPALLEAGKDLLFPTGCLACRRPLADRNLPLLCSSCWEAILFISSPLCLRCGHPFPTGVDHLCGSCLGGAFEFDLARSVVAYREIIPALIQSFKYHGNLSGLASMGAIAQKAVCYQDLSRPDLILPVPLHKKRLRERGFNQSLLLARRCFPQWSNSICHDVLSRNRQTAAQTKLSGIKRRKNLKGAFTVAQADRVAGKHILLVDDVFTTGTTVNECSKQLLLAGASRVEVFTLAKGV